MTAATTSTSREAVGAGSARGGAEDVWASIDGEVGGRPK